MNRRKFLTTTIAAGIATQLPGTAKGEDSPQTGGQGMMEVWVRRKEGPPATWERVHMVELVLGDVFTLIFPDGELGKGLMYRAESQTYKTQYGNVPCVVTKSMGKIDIDKDGVQPFGITDLVLRIPLDNREGCEQRLVPCLKRALQEGDFYCERRTASEGTMVFNRHHKLSTS